MRAAWTAPAIVVPAGQDESMRGRIPDDSGVTDRFGDNGFVSRQVRLRLDEVGCWVAFGHESIRETARHAPGRV